MDFVHLHLHSEYSLLDGACRISDIPAAAKAAGHKACAVTDHGVMYGALQFYKACKKEGIKPIIGCEVYLSAGSRFDKNYSDAGETSHLVLLCENAEGYKNLVYMVTCAFTEGFYSKPRIDMELLRSHSKGLIALSACLGGRIPKLISAGNYSAAQEHALEMKSIFGADRFYLELQDHGISEQAAVNRALCEMSEKLGIGLVVTNDVHYLKKADSEAQAVLMCIQTGNVITDGKPIGFETDEFYYKSTEEMAALFPEHPEALSNTVKIADMCNLELEFGKTHIPAYSCPDGEKPYDFLRSLTEAGLEKREKSGAVNFSEIPREKYTERVEYELSVIESMGYTQYFLVVWDFVNYAKSKGIPVGPGRGSGAGSLVAFLIGITDIDSIKFGLLFERFLNPERVSMPDFDIDFCYDRRDEVIEYVREKYGKERTAQIITFGTMAARAAVRDVGRALGMSYGEVDAVARLIPQELGITLDAALKNRELREMYNDSPRIRRLLDTSRALEGMPRHASTHAAGVVITEAPLTEYLPLAVNNGVTVTQYNMDDVAELGLLKFDFLALRYLTIIDAAQKQIREREPDFDITKIPLDDKKTYALISRGATDGVFQLESGGMRQMLTQLKPESINDITAAIALYRPGPMDSIPRYIEARHSGIEPRYVTEKLKPILDETYGCIVYQEQVMRIFRDLAGYSLGHADIVRRAISKKKTEVLLSEREAFVNGAVSNGVEREAAVSLFDSIASFANYAFNKSHAAAYAVISYRTAYLKAHYLTEYNCALLVSVQGNPAKISEYIAECKRYGIEVLPPDINRSMTDFHVEGGNIRFGLAALKNVGRAFIDELIALRRRDGAFADADDFIARMKSCNMNKRQLEALIKSGSLDSLGPKRSQLLAVHEHLLDKGGGVRALEGQLDMFSDIGGGKMSMPSIEYPDIPEFSLKEKLILEKESSGMYLSGHLLDDYSLQLEKIKPDRISDILSSFTQDAPTVRYREKQQVTVAGIITKRTNKNTRGGEPMAFVTLEDRSGEIEAVVFPKVLEEFSHVLLVDSAVSVTGTVSVKDEEDAKLLVRSIDALQNNTEYRKANKSHTVYLKISSLDSEEYKRLTALMMVARGNTPVVVYEERTKKSYKSENCKISIDAFTLSELKKLLGEDSVVIK